MTMVREILKSTIARLVRETDHRPLRIIEHYVSKVYMTLDLAKDQAVGVDEFRNRRSHECIPMFVNLEDKRFLFARPSKDAQTLGKLSEYVAAHGGNTGIVTALSIDLFPAFQKEAADHLLNAQIILDRLHLMKLINKVADGVRKKEVFLQPGQKTSRKIWLMNPGKLSAKQSAKSQGLLKAWVMSAKASGPRPLVKIAYTLRNLWDGVMRWFDIQITNKTLLEGFNCLLQTAKAEARGSRIHKHSINMVDLIFDKVDLRLHDTSRNLAI
jgi:transposase